MGFLQFLKRVLDSINPSVYKGLTQKPLKSTIAHMLILILVYTLLVALVNAPSYYKTYKDIDIGNIEDLSVNINIKTKAPVKISNNPLIIIDTSDNRSYDNEKILITKDTLYRKWLFKTYDHKIDNIELLGQNFKKHTIILILILIPSIYVLGLIYVILKYLSISIIFTLLGLIILKIIKKEAAIIEIFISSIYALTIFFIANIISSFYYIPFLGIILYTIIFILSILLLNEEVIQFRSGPNS